MEPEPKKLVRTTNITTKQMSKLMEHHSVRELTFDIKLNK